MSRGPLFGGRAALLVVAAACGCAGLKSGSDRAPAEGGSPETQIDVLRCGHKRPPPPPDAGPSGGNLDLVFAVTHYYYGTASTDDAGNPQLFDLGFDMDDVCTGEGQGPSCIEPSWATASHNDGPRGIDNAVGQFAAAVDALALDEATASPDTPDLVFRVSGYSGDPDDDQVTASFYIGLGVAPRADGGPELLWDGQDRWNVMPEVLAPSDDGGAPSYDVDRPKFQDTAAYVNGGVLVMRLQHIAWPVGSPLAPTSLGSIETLVLTGNLVRVGSLWELQGITTGAVADARRFLATAARFPQSGNTSVPVCQAPDQYRSLKQRLCSFVDIAAGSSSPTATCDALSGGSHLEAKQALLGGVSAPAAPLPPCDPSIDPDTDSCD